MIKAGDLVVVTRPAPCCGESSRIGYTFVVSLIDVDVDFECGRCKAELSGISVAASGKRLGKGLEGFRLSRLTRIDPLPESETHRDEVTA